MRQTMKGEFLFVFLTLFSCSAVIYSMDNVMSPFILEESLKYMVNPSVIQDSFQSLTDNENASDVMDVCHTLLTAYANHSSNFTKCLVQNARPFRFCETCVVPYTRASALFRNMTGNTACQKALLMADRVQIVRLVNTNMANIWTTANCQNCFASIEEDFVNDTVNFKLTNNTELFLDLFDNMTECLNFTIQNIDPSHTIKRNISYCHQCKTHYTSLNKHFTKMMEQTKSLVCMDVVDMMNYTRLMWSKTLHCSHRQGTLAPVLVITGVISALPVIFYVANRVVRQKTEKTIVIQRRMKFPRTNSNSNSYGSFSGSQQTPVNSNSLNSASNSSFQGQR